MCTHTNVEYSFTFHCRCDGLKTCVIPVLPSHFPDACPNTPKYLEIHYACRRTGNPGQDDRVKSPPWMVKSHQQQHPEDNVISSQVDSSDQVTSASPRKPILVTEKAKVTKEAPAAVTKDDEGEAELRVPITTPKPKRRKNLQEPKTKSLEHVELSTPTGLPQAVEGKTLNSPNS